MKTLFKLLTIAVLLVSCGKQKPKEYIANLTQSGVNAPDVSELRNKFGKINWKRNEAGIYQGDYEHTFVGKINVVIDETANVNQMVRVHVNDKYIQVYSCSWNDELKEWEFSDDVLLNTSLRIMFFK